MRQIWGQQGDLGPLRCNLFESYLSGPDDGTGDWWVHQFPTSRPPLGLAGPAVGQMWGVAHVISQPEAAHAACGSKEGSERGRRVVGKRGERREVRGRREGGEVKKGGGIWRGWREGKGEGQGGEEKRGVRRWAGQGIPSDTQKHTTSININSVQMTFVRGLASVSAGYRIA